MVALGGRAVSYERGTPVPTVRWLRVKQGSKKYMRSGKRAGKANSLSSRDGRRKFAFPILFSDLMSFSLQEMGEREERDCARAKNPGPSRISQGTLNEDTLTRACIPLSITRPKSAWYTSGRFALPSSALPALFSGGGFDRGNRGVKKMRAGTRQRKQTS